MSGATLGSKRGRGARVAIGAVALAVALFVGLLFVSSGARAGVDSFLLAFREQQPVSKLTIIIAPLPAAPAAGPNVSASSLTSLAQLQLNGGHTVAVVDDAQALLGFNVGHINRFPRPTDITVYQNTTAQLVPDQVAIQQLVSAAVGGQARLPAQLTATTIQAQVDGAVRQRWDTLGIALTYWQMQPPHLETTSGPSVDSLRAQVIQAYLAVQPQLAQQLLSVTDWDHTIVIPIPPGARQQRVRFNGQSATLIESQGPSGPDSYLIWANRGIFNYVHAPIAGQQLLNELRGFGG